MRLWNYLRTFKLDEWVALAILVGASTIVLWNGIAGAWNLTTFSLQPEMVNNDPDGYDLVAQRSMGCERDWQLWQPPSETDITPHLV